MIEAAITVRQGARGRRQGRAVQDLRQGARAEARPAWRRSWRSGRRTGRARAVTFTCRSSPRTASRCSTTPAQPHSMSETMRWFVGGQQKLMPELLAMIAPTVNSYRRLIPGFWAPTDSTWGVENRTTALRVIPGSAEIAASRVSGSRRPTANPYIILAAALGSGLWGIENKVEPEPVGDRQRLRPQVPGAARAAAHAVGCRAAAQGVEDGARTGSATSSSSTTPRRANGKSASSASTSATGSWRATSRSSERRRFGMRAGRHRPGTAIMSGVLQHHFTGRRTRLCRAPARGTARGRRGAGGRARGAARLALRAARAPQRRC